MSDLAFEIIKSISYLILFIFMILISKWIRETVAKKDITKELVINDNVAFNISYGGYILAVSIIFLGSLFGPEKGIFLDLFIVFIYSLLGIILLNISQYLNDKFILGKFSNSTEIFENHNLAVGVVQFGTYISSALIISGSLYGEDQNTWLTLAFFVIGQLGLIIYSHFYEWLTPYSVHEELKNKNHAAGIAMTGNLLGAGIIMFKGALTEYQDWRDGIIFFIVCIVIVFISQPIIRIFINKIIIPESNLDHEIKNDQNSGAAFLELVFLISFSILIFAIL